MIDIKLIRENPEMVKENIKKNTLLIAIKIVCTKKLTLYAIADFILIFIALKKYLTRKLTILLSPLEIYGISMRRIRDRF